MNVRLVMIMGQTVGVESFLKQRNYLLTELLLLAVTCAILVWFLSFLWRRRKLYQASRKLPGPFALPLIGSALSFIGKPSEIFTQIHEFFLYYPELFKVWFGPRLFYGVSDPKYFEILLTSQHVLRKEYLYRMAEPVTGLGLFTAPEIMEVSSMIFNKVAEIQNMVARQHTTVPDPVMFDLPAANEYKESRITGQNEINVFTVDKWRKHRKIITPTFNQKILDQFVEVFVEQSEVLVKVMEKYAGKGEIDIIDLMSRCTLDIICETAMGVQIKAQSTDSNFPRWVDRIMEIVMIRIFNILYHSDFLFNHSPLGKDFHNLNNQLRSFTKKVVTDKRIQYEKKIESTEDQYIEEEITKRKAFLDLLIEMNYEKDGNHHFTDDDLMDETITFMIGGSDTTASSNCFTLTMLGMHPDIQNKVLAEIVDVIGPHREVQLSDLPQFRYLERIIKESLRLFPVAAFLVRSLDEDIDIADHVLQKGSSIVFGIFRVHRNEKYWPDPFKFNPDRFLPEEVAKRSPGCHVPFSFGPRNCIGIKYAMMAMKALLATVLRKYKIHTSYKSVEEIELKTNLMLRPINGYKVSLELRT